MTNLMMRQRKYIFIVSEGKAIQMFCIRVCSTKAIKEAKANDPLDFILLLWSLFKSLIFRPAEIIANKRVELEIVRGVELSEKFDCV